MLTIKELSAGYGEERTAWIIIGMIRAENTRDRIDDLVERAKKMNQAGLIFDDEMVNVYLEAKMRKGEIMNKREYYIRRGQFANEYTLRYACTTEEVSWLIDRGFERISRRLAEKLARAERARRKADQAFSGYADDTILWVDYELGDIVYCDGVIGYPSEYYR